MQKFRGTGVAVITPFKDDLSIDFDALEKIINNLISNGLDYLVALGTTSEVATLKPEEIIELVHFFIKKVDKRVHLVIGAASQNNTAYYLDFMQEIDALNFDAYLSVCPYYNRPNQNALYAHFEAVANSTKKDIILYNVPSRTGCNLLPETTVRLAKDFENIIAIKAASGSVNQTMQIIADKPNDFKVISGDDGLTLAKIAAGADGLISVSANAFPDQICAMVNAALSNDYATAQNIHYAMFRMHQLIFEEGNPTGIKCAMANLNLCENYLRLPLIKASSTLQKMIVAELNA